MSKRSRVELFEQIRKRRDHDEASIAELARHFNYGGGDTRVAVEAAAGKVTARTEPPAASRTFAKTDFHIDPGRVKPDGRRACGAAHD